MEKIYLTQEQKEYIWYKTCILEDTGFRKEILNSTWYIIEHDTPEQYVGDILVYPYGIVVEEIDYLLDYITKETFEEILNVPSNQFEYKGKYYFIGKVENFYTGVIFELHEEDMDELIDWFIWDEIETKDAIKMAKDLIDIHYKEKESK